MSEHKFKVGDVVAIAGRHGSAPRKTVVTNVTPTGRFLIEGHPKKFMPDGREVGAYDIWTRLYVHHWTDADTAAVEEDKMDMRRVRLSQYNWRGVPNAIVPKFEALIAEVEAVKAK